MAEPVIDMNQVLHRPDGSAMLVEYYEPEHKARAEDLQRKLAMSKELPPIEAEELNAMRSTRPRRLGDACGEALYRTAQRVEEGSPVMEPIEALRWTALAERLVQEDEDGSLPSVSLKKPQREAIMHAAKTVLRGQIMLEVIRLVGGQQALVDELGSDWA